MNKSTVVGSATAEAVGTDSTKVTVSIDKAPPASVLHWNLHAGTCASGMTPVGDPAWYPALRTVEGGDRAEVTATLPIKPTFKGDYSVQVHAPVPAPSVREHPEKAIKVTAVISCGEFEPVTTSSGGW